MKKFTFIISALTLLFCVSSCSHRLVDFTIISTKNVPIGNSMEGLNKAPTRVKGVDKKHWVLFFPLGFPSMKEAIDKAIEKYPGAIALCDGVLKQNSWHIFLYGQNSYIVEGTPLYLSDVKASGFDVEEVRGTLSITHEVKNGETLHSIAQEYGVTISDLIRWNKLNSAKIYPTQEIRVLIK